MLEAQTLEILREKLMLNVALKWMKKNLLLLTISTMMLKIKEKYTLIVTEQANLTDAVK